jgi:hypothetical protein
MVLEDSGGQGVRCSKSCSSSHGHVAVLHVLPPGAADAGLRVRPGWCAAWLGVFLRKQPGAWQLRVPGWLYRPRTGVDVG